MEIKRPITGMIHTLRDKTVQTYQEEIKIEGKTIKQEEEEEAFSLPAAQSSVQPLAHEQHSTKTQSSLNHSNTNDMALPPAPAAMATESSCCMCNCKSTLQAILLELRTMRKLIQTQRGTRNKRSSQIPVTWSRSSISRWRTRKRRSGHRVTKRTTPPTPSSEADVREMLCREDTSSTWAPSTPDPVISKVQLVEDYDVFIPKAQLDSILLNYTRSGSLLFRKLVCAFFDDATLANSLPSGKRKRGLNDHRKGLDQNIVGAIRVFTEKYCAANGIEKLPAPSDWVQILQDQIKLARRRFKRAETVLDSNEIQHRTCRVKTEECEQPLNKVEIMTQNGAYERTERLVAMDTT